MCIQNKTVQIEAVTKLFLMLETQLGRMTNFCLQREIFAIQLQQFLLLSASLCFTIRSDSHRQSPRARKGSLVINSSCVSGLR